MKQTLLLFAFLGTLTMFAQGTVTGTLIDEELGSPLGGANIVEMGTTNGAISDFDGNFSMTVSSDSGTLNISYIGYGSETTTYTLTNGVAALGNISVAPDADALGEVVVIGTGIIDLAEDRETPVAVSTIRQEEIQRKGVGNVEITEILKNTPSVYVSGQTGFGDGQLFLRGFDNSNVAVLLNGQPINAMEDGRVFWSNWSGIADVATAMQIQRGLGSSKLAISSVGGTTNIVMKAADKNEGGYARFLGGNDSYFKGTVAYNTGLSDKGWAFSVLLDHWQAHRKWAKGTYGQGQNYYFAVGYKPNDTHAFNFLVTGAPQMHGQRFSQRLSIIDADPKYNQHWGYTDDGIESERQNFYHKPVINLNWDWNMGENTDLATVVYASFGRGGGTGPRGARPLRTEDPDGSGGQVGQLDYDAIIAANTAIGVGDNAEREGYIRRASMNNHAWYGVISNLGHEFSENLNVNFGVDFRFYTGDHFRQVTDLYGLSGWANDRPDGATVTNTYDATPWAALFNFADEGDRIDYDYSETINYQGGFGQLEYATDKFSVFFQGAVSNQSYEREGRFDDPGKSDKLSKIGYNVKGGVSYAMAENHQIFVNAGYYSRQPFLDNIFRNVRTSNELLSPEVDNEDITSFEAGYRLKLGKFTANFNAYVTDWKNRTISSFSILDANGIPEDEDDINATVLERNVDQYHSGAELDFRWRMMNWLTVQGYLSAGSWVYRGTSLVTVFNDDTNEIISEEAGQNRSGIKISTAPQFTAGLGANAKICKGFSVDGNINYQANHYKFTDTRTEENPGKLKPYSLTDIGMSYEFDLGSNELVFRGNVFNAFDEIRIQQNDRFGFINTNGRTYNASVKYKF